MMTPSDYLELFDSCKIGLDSVRLTKLYNVCRIAILNQAQYVAVQNVTNVPWPVVAAIHFRESSQSFHCHLHNGDPLTAKTVHIPAGRPVAGMPPYLWAVSAIDALKGYWRPIRWDLAGCLEYLERYNGLGYRKHDVLTPYLWDYTDKYTSGLFVADGSFDPDEKEDRPGCVAILKTLAERGIRLDFSCVSSIAPVVE